MLYFYTAAPLFLLVSMDQVVIQPNNAIFTCTATGLPRPLIQWRVKTSNTQILLSNSTQFLIYENITVERERISTLRLLQTNANNTGNYTCIAENIVASINSTSTLTMYGKNTSIIYADYIIATVFYFEFFFSYTYYQTTRH